MTAKQDFQNLLDGALPFAKQMLLAEGEFIPFGATLAPNVPATLVAGDVGKEHPKSGEVIEMLTKSFATDAADGKIVAAAICFMASTDAQGGAKQDVAVFRMSHVCGETLDVFLPYVVKKPDEVLFNELFASKGAANFLRRHLH